MTTLADLPILALILFAPWFAILSALFWLFPRQPRDAARRRFDLIALSLALLAFVVSLYLSHAHADPGHHLWPQVLATSVGYGVYLLALAIALIIRQRWLRRRAIDAS